MPRESVLNIHDDTPAHVVVLSFRLDSEEMNASVDDAELMLEEHMTGQGWELFSDSWEVDSCIREMAFDNDETRTPVINPNRLCVELSMLTGRCVHVAIGEIQDELL